MNEEDYFNNWYSDHKSSVLTEFAISNKLPTDENSIIDMEEEYIDEILKYAKEQMYEYLDIEETDNQIINSYYGGKF